jgi:hypothetical protein
VRHKFRARHLWYSPRNLFGLLQEHISYVHDPALYDGVLNNVSSTSSAYPCTISSGLLHASPYKMLFSRVAASGGALRLADLREGLYSASDLVML